MHNTRKPPALLTTGRQSARSGFHLVPLTSLVQTLRCSLLYCPALLHSVRQRLETTAGHHRDEALGGPTPGCPAHCTLGLPSVSHPASFRWEQARGPGLADGTEQGAEKRCWASASGFPTRALGWSLLGVQKEKQHTQSPDHTIQQKPEQQPLREQAQPELPQRWSGPTTTTTAAGSQTPPRALPWPCSP